MANIVLGKPLRILPEVELFEPVRNLLHRRPPTDSALSVLDRQEKKSTTCADLLSRPGESALRTRELRASARFGDERGRARKNNFDFGELAGLRIDLYRPCMLLHDDVVSDGEAKASAFPGRLGREEGIEHLFLHLSRDARAVIANRDLYAVAEVFR